MSTHETTRRKFDRGDPHSALCDASRGHVTFVRDARGYNRPVSPLCTCAAGLLALMRGAR